MNPASEPTQQPEQFGPYELYERLGMGGMATVFRAKKRGPEGFERVVALKRMLQHLAEDASFVDSFIREAKVASMLAHPNIAQVYDFGRIGGVYYIAMEFVAGFDLRRLLRYANRANEPIAMPVVFSILAELCDALEFAHTFVDDTGTPARIVHRDISPSNLIVSPTGHLKVIDFGIAKASMGHLRTETGMVKGKLGYMAPEVALGMSVGPSADVFSMGVVAWELITASPLFTARTDFETMRKLREGEIQPPSELNPTCPPELDQIVLQALARDEDQRIPSAGMFRRLLDGIAARYGIAMSSHAVSEWLRMLPQTQDGYRNSQLPGSLAIGAERETAMLRPSSLGPGTKLKRSTEEISLASDIWGEDAKTAIPSGASGDWDAASLAVGPARNLPLPAPPVTRIGTPVPSAPPTMPSMPSMMAPTRLGTAEVGLGPQPFVSQLTSLRPRRRGLFVAVAVLVVAGGAVGGYLVSKQSSASPKLAEPSAEAETPPPPTIARGKLKVAIAPDGAVVEIGGKEVGHTPLALELDPGMYSVAAHQDGYKPWSGTVTLAAGGSETIDIALERAVVVATVAPTPTPTPTPPVHGKSHGSSRGSHSTHVAEVKQPDPEPETKPDPTPTPVEPPPPPPPPKPDPIVKKDPPPPTVPARTPVVGASAVTKIAGELPAIRADAESGDVLAKLCIDDQGRVTSTKIVTAPVGVAEKLAHAFDGWRYKPYLNQANKPSAVCFPVTMHVVVKRPD